MKHLRPYNELFNIFKRKNIDVNALPDKDMLTDLIVSDIPDEVDFKIEEVIFRYEKNGDPRVPTDVKFPSQIGNNYNRVSPPVIPPVQDGYRKGYVVYFSIEGNNNRPLHTTVDDFINEDRFKEFGIKCYFHKPSTGILFYSIS